MTAFWAVETQFDAASGWVLVGGLPGPQRLHVVVEGPNPDPRRPAEPQVVAAPADASGIAILRLENVDRPAPGRFPLYVLALALPNGRDLASHGGGVSWGGRRRNGQYPPSVLNALFDNPSSDVVALTATLYDDDEVIATGRLVPAQIESGNTV